MPTRTQKLTQLPWQGGLNTSLNAALITSDELVMADNVVFDTSGSRKSRAGFQFFDYIAESTHRSSSGTTRTLRVTINSGQSINTNDVISVHTSGSTNSDYDILAATVTSSTNVAGAVYDIVYTYPGESLTESSTADTNIRVGKYVDENIIGFYDFYYFSAGSKVQKRVGVSSAGNFYQYSSTGSKTAIAVDAGVSLTSTPITTVSFATLGNLLIMAFSGVNNEVVKWDGTSDILPLTNTTFAGVDVTATNPPPNLQYLRVHQNRLWGTDKADPDRIHYSDIDNPERWNGEGDSGVVDLQTGDLDNSGLTALFPSFKGRLFATRNNQLYQISGEAPYYKAEIISDGIGCTAHGSASAVDQDDVLYASKKGFHSLLASDAFGGFEGTFLSKPIQTTFNAWDPSAQPSIRSIYMPSLNAVLFSGRETGQSNNNVIYILNIDKSAGQTQLRWYKWSSSVTRFKIECFGKFIANNLDVLLIGTHQGRLLKYDTTRTVDFVDSPIAVQIKSGIIYPDGNPATYKGFKKIGVLYKTARDAITFTVDFKIDNFSLQTNSISQTPSSDLLGSTFTLGSSLLGGNPSVLLPEYVSVDGYGYGAQIQVTSNSPIEVFGYVIEFEQAGDAQEVIR